MPCASSKPSNVCVLPPLLHETPFAVESDLQSQTAFAVKDEKGSAFDHAESRLPVRLSGRSALSIKIGRALFEAWRDRAVGWNGDSAEGVRSTGLRAGCPREVGRQPGKEDALCPDKRKGPMGPLQCSMVSDPERSAVSACP